jgi:hypothetical protein
MGPWESVPDLEGWPDSQDRMDRVGIEEIGAEWLTEA